MKINRWEEWARSIMMKVRCPLDHQPCYPVKSNVNCVEDYENYVKSMTKTKEKKKDG